MDAAQSAAITMLAPAGVVAEPDDRQGAAAILSEMICRGAGDLDARAHSEALDQLGVRRDTDVQSTHLSVSASMIGAKLPESLPLLTDMIRRPALPDEGLEPSRDLSLQAIDALEDEPQQKVFVLMRGQHFNQPFDRSLLGCAEHIEKMTLAQVRAFHESAAVPGGMIVGIAGRFDWDQLRDDIGDLLGDWSGDVPAVELGDPPPRGYRHENADTTQVHIGVIYDAVPETDSNSVLQRTAASVLSGGMGARLFTEVREKRGLCYAVFANYGSNKHFGAMLSYAGTTAARAQETLDVLTAELRRISDGVEPDELARAVIGMKSNLVMQGESTAARAYAIATDQYLHGRPRTLDERIAEIDGVTLDAINGYLRDHPAGDMTIVTIGPQPLRPGGS